MGFPHQVALVLPFPERQGRGRDRSPAAVRHHSESRLSETDRRYAQEMRHNERYGSSQNRSREGSHERSTGQRMGDEFKHFDKKDAHTRIMDELATHLKSTLILIGYDITSGDIITSRVCQGYPLLIIKDEIPKKLQ
jgi:hypothetical protein